MGAFAHDQPGLVVACRRLLDRQPACAPLWWLASRVLSSVDPGSEALQVLDELAADPTFVALERHADECEGNPPLVIDAFALGSTGCLARPGSREAAGDACRAGSPVWAVAGVGVVLPDRLWSALVARLRSNTRGNVDEEGSLRADGPPDDLLDAGGWQVELVPIEMIDAVIGPRGKERAGERLAWSSFLVAAELL